MRCGLTAGAWQAGEPCRQVAGMRPEAATALGALAVAVPVKGEGGQLAAQGRAVLGGMEGLLSEPLPAQVQGRLGHRWGTRVRARLRLLSWLCPQEAVSL